MNTQTQLENKRFILPISFEGAPNPSVLIEVELRFVKNINRENYGKVSIFTDSHYQPLNIEGYMTFEEGVKLVESKGCIAVKSNFDQYNIQDLKEIKHLLSEKWIEGFNNRQAAN